MPSGSKARIVAPASCSAGRIDRLGLSRMSWTDDMRESPSLSILPPLVEAGATIRAFDPEGMTEARKLLPQLVYCDDAYQAMDGADALVLLTEWNEFRGLDLERIRSLLRAPVVIDLRNIYQPHDMTDAGLVYHSIGRSTVTSGAAETETLGARTSPNP